MTGIKQRMHKEADEGFTLIELMVVVLILGILMAIAIPTFLSLTNNAKKDAAQADLTTAVTDAAVYFTANGTYGTDTKDVVNNLMTGDGNIQWIPDDGGGTAGTAGAKQVLVNYVGPTEIDLGVMDANSTYYWVDDSSGTTMYSDPTEYKPGDPSLPGDFPLTSLP